MEMQNTKKRLFLKDIQLEKLDIQLSLISNYLELSRIMINELLEQETIERAGEHYSRKKSGSGCRRWGTNPGSVKLGDRKLKVEVPRLRDLETGKCVPLESYKKMKQMEAPSEEMQAKVIKGLSTRDYSSITNDLIDSFGLSKSSISDQTKAKMAENLKHFESRDLSNHDIIAIILDGKYLRKHQVIIALGVTIQGHKIALGFLQSGSENGRVVEQLFRDMEKRGFKYNQGILVVVDGAKGLYKGVKSFFGNFAKIQRCRWHKRENLLSYLNEQDKQPIKNRFDIAMNREDYEDAKGDLMAIHRDLKDYNRSAANSLLEGIEELLTLQKLGLNEKFKRTFGTTNSIESLNSQIVKYTRKAKRWYDSDMIYRWIATALLEIEPNLNKVFNSKHLRLMREQINSTLSISTKNRT